MFLVVLSFVLFGLSMHFPVDSISLYRSARRKASRKPKGNMAGC